MKWSEYLKSDMVLIDWDFFLETLDVNFISIDVGLSQEAVPASRWLSKQRKDKGMIGIEPLPYNCQCLINDTGKNRHLPHLSLKENAIKQGSNYLCDITNRYNLLQGAIDDVEYLKFSEFFIASPDTGNCSLKKENIDSIDNPNSISGSCQVPTFPLKFIIQYLDKYPIIENLKIDTEGNDFNCIKSCGDYLNKVAFLSVECGRGILKKSKKQVDTASPIIKHLEPYGFKIIDDSFDDYKFVNKNLKNDILKYNLTCMDGDHAVFNFDWNQI
jgi:hypothetical protein